MWQESWRRCARAQQGPRGRRGFASSTTRVNYVCVYMCILVCAWFTMLWCIHEMVNTWINIGKGTKTHLYWCMKFCDGSADDLRQKIMGISKHYQVFTDNITNAFFTFYSLHRAFMTRAMWAPHVEILTTPSAASYGWSSCNWSVWKGTSADEHLSLCRVIRSCKYTD